MDDLLRLGFRFDGDDGGGTGGEGDGGAATEIADAGGTGIGGNEGDGGEEKSGKTVEDSIARLSERMDEFMEKAAPQGGDEDELAGLFDADYFGDAADDDDDYEYLDDDDDAAGGEYASEEERLAATADQIVEQLVDQKVQERLAPHLQEQHEERRHAQVVQLEEKYPDLKTRDNAVPLLKAAAGIAQRLGEPELAFEADFLETVHLRMKAEAARAEETASSGEGDAPIEGAGGGNANSGESAEAAARKLVVDASKGKGSIFG